MILFINLYENYTIASSNRFLMSVKVWKRCNNQMIEYIKFYNTAVGIFPLSLFTIFTHDGAERHVSCLAPHYFLRKMRWPCEGKFTITNK